MTALERSVEAWRKCKPSAMAEASPAAIYYSLNAARHDVLALADTLNEVHNWLVCAPIATPEDMAQRYEYMEKLIAKALGL